MKNYYKVNAVINNDYYQVNKKFETRLDAINYAFKLINRKYIYNVEVEEEFPLNGDKHNVQYVLKDNVRFSVARVNA